MFSGRVFQQTVGIPTGTTLSFHTGASEKTEKKLA